MKGDGEGGGESEGGALDQSSSEAQPGKERRWYAAGRYSMVLLTSMHKLDFGVAFTWCVGVDREDAYVSKSKSSQLFVPCTHHT